MDPASFAGLGLALMAIFVSMILDGGNPASLFTHPAPLLLVFGGTFGVAMASVLMKDATGVAGFAMKALMAKVHPADDAIKNVVKFAEQARRDGLLALEESAKGIDDEFLRKGIELAVDGTDPEELREILETDIRSMKARHKVGAKFFADMGAFAPTIGIIGTVMGLIHVLENLDKPATLGPAISAAFLATLWGVLSANVFWLPIANKLKRVSEIEAHHKELMLEGILSIQAGANPRTIEQKLLAYLPPKQRDALSSKAA